MENVSLVMKYMPFLIRGLGYTILVSVAAIAIAVCVGMLLSLLRLTNNRILNGFVNVYVSFVRGTPVIVQIFIIYYVIAMLGIDVSALLSGIIALSLNSGGFMSEIIRGGLSAIPQGQYEAAVALGMPKHKIWLRIIFPQVFHHAMPQLTSEFINVIKVSPMLSIISVVELTRAAQRLVTQTYVTLPFYIAIGIIYFIVDALLEEVVKYQERKVQQRK